MVPRSKAKVVALLTEHLKARPEVLEAYLFGSWARGTAAGHSDIDVAVYLGEEPDLPPFGYAQHLASDLMRSVGSDRVDLVVLNRARPLLYHRVLRDGLRLFARDLRATTTREGQALSRYCDLVPQLAKIDVAAARRTARGELGR